MDIDPELQNAIDEFIKQIEAKSDVLLDFKHEIDNIISASKQEARDLLKTLDEKFDSYEINEEEYLAKLRAEKENILNATKEKLNTLLANFENSQKQS